MRLRRASVAVGEQDSLIHVKKLKYKKLCMHI